MWMKRICAAGLLALAWLNAGAVELLDLSSKDLGIAWSASPSELAARFPGLKPAKQPGSHVYRGPVQLDGLSLGDRVVDFRFDPSGHLDHLVVWLDRTDPSRVASILDQRLGSGRWVADPQAGMHMHAYEWNVGPHCIGLVYTATSAERGSKQVVAEYPGSLQIDAKRPGLTLVDLVLERATVATPVAAAATPTAGAPQLLEPSRSDLGIDWSASAAELAKKFPGLKPAGSRGHAYRGPLRLVTLSYADEVVLFDFDQAGNLQSLYMGMDGNDAIQLIGVLSRQLGQGRWGSYPDMRVHIHAYDWNVGPHTIELMYVGSSAERLSKPAASMRVSARMCRSS